MARSKRFNRQQAKTHDSRQSPRREKLDRYRRKAAEALKKKNYDSAERLHAAILDMKPNDSQARSGLAQALQGNGAVERCEVELRRLAADEPDSYDYQMFAAGIFEQQGNVAEAIEHYRAAGELGEDRAIAWSKAARALERLHRWDESQEAVDRALSCNPRSPDALLAKAAIHARLGESDKVADQLNDLLKRPNLPTNIQIQARYTLAQALDELEQYDEVMKVLQKAKRLQISTIPRYLVEATRRQTQKSIDLTERIEPRHFSPPGWRVSEHRRLAILLGFPESGAAGLGTVLDQHDDLVVAAEFPAIPRAVIDSIAHRHQGNSGPIEMLEKLDVAEIDSLRTDYFLRIDQHLRGSIGSRMLLDINPAMTLTLPFMKRIFPDMRTLVALRDPRDVVVRCFMLATTDFNTMTLHYLSLKDICTLYEIQMKGWLRYREILEEDYLEIRHEDLLQDLPAQTRHVFDHFGLTWDNRVLDRHHRVDECPDVAPMHDKGPHPISSESIGHWKNYAKYLEPTMEQLAPYLEQFGYED